MSVHEQTHPHGSQPDGSPTTGPEAGDRAHVTLRLFAAARQTAGTGRAEVVAATVGEVLTWACGQYGPAFAAVVDYSCVWCNGEPADADTVLVDGDEVAVLPPVSGGADGLRLGF
jgi:molybdopterin converting factor small subunit